MDPGAVDASGQITAWVWTCVGLSIAATVAVFIRMLARFRTIVTWGYDDTLIVISLVPLWALVGVGIDSKCLNHNIQSKDVYTKTLPIVAYHGGMGQPQNTLSSDQSRVFFQVPNPYCPLMYLCR